MCTLPKSQWTKKGSACCPMCACTVHAWQHAEEAQGSQSQTRTSVYSTCWSNTKATSDEHSRLLLIGGRETSRLKFGREIELQLAQNGRSGQTICTATASKNCIRVL